MPEDKRKRLGHFSIEIKLHRFQHDDKDGNPYTGWQGAAVGMDGVKIGSVRDATAMIVLAKLAGIIESHLLTSGEAPEG